ncbi:unnamed protein product, partial [Discosporangium mesarthrocarpum]
SAVGGTGTGVAGTCGGVAEKSLELRDLIRSVMSHPLIRDAVQLSFRWSDERHVQGSCLAGTGPEATASLRRLLHLEATLAPEKDLCPPEARLLFIRSITLGRLGDATAPTTTAEPMPGFLSGNGPTMGGCVGSGGDGDRRGLDTDAAGGAAGERPPWAAEGMGGVHAIPALWAQLANTLFQNPGFITAAARQLQARGACALNLMGGPVPLP